MDYDIARGYKNKFQNVVDEVDAAKNKLRSYDISDPYVNTWFDGADLMYQPEKSLDNKATILVNRANAIRQHLVAVKGELDTIRTIAQGKVSYYQNIMNQEDD